MLRPVRCRTSLISARYEQGRARQGTRRRHPQPVHPDLQGASSWIKAGQGADFVAVQPALLFALEDYFNNPSLSVLSNLYDSLNSMDTSGLPSLTRDERLVLRSSERKDLFEEKFVAAAAAASADLADESGGVRSSKRRTASGNRGSAPTDAVPGHDEEVLSSSRPASTDGGGQLRGIPSSDSLASASLDSAHSPSIGTSAAASRDDLSLHGGRSSRANTISSMDDGRSGWSHSYASAVPPPPLPNRQSSGAATTKSAESSSRSQASPTMSHRAGGAGARPKDTHFFETKVVYNGISIPVKIPVATFPSEIGDVRCISHAIPPPVALAYARPRNGTLALQYSLIKLVQTFSGPTSLAPGPILPQLHTSGPSTPALIVLLNAILTGHRVVFLGHQQPAGRVAELVLAACALASGSGAILQGFEERAFPYTNLSNLDNLQNVYVRSSPYRKAILCLCCERSRADGFLQRTAQASLPVCATPPSPTAHRGGTSSATWRRARWSSRKSSSRLRRLRLARR